MDFMKDLRENLRYLVQKMGLLEESESQCCGVTLTQCHAIGEIGRGGALSLNELADRLGLDKSTMSRTLNQLVELGYADRTADANDRRYVTISLTDEGASQFDKIESFSERVHKSVMHHVPEDQREQVVESLQILVQAFEKAMKEQNCC